VVLFVSVFKNENCIKYVHLVCEKCRRIPTAILDKGYLIHAYA